MVKITWLIGAVVACASLAPECLRAQSTPVTHAFEVVSIKPSSTRSSPGPVAPNRFLRLGITLMQLVAYGFDASEAQIEVGDEWMSSVRFDVDALAARNSTEAHKRGMVRNLLAERFRLKAHVETQQRPRYALVKAHGDGRLGDKIRSSKSNCLALTSGDGRRLSDASELGSAPRCGFLRLARPGSMIRRMIGFPTAELARQLQREARRVVVDRTGLAGEFDIMFEVESAPIPPSLSGLSDLPPVAREGLSLFTALEEQLGLKLVSERGPVQVLVIDHAERPTPN